MSLWLNITVDKSALVQLWQQAIAWANVDPDFCCHMVSLSQNDLKYSVKSGGLNNM